jgi:hypothetical protein
LWCKQHASATGLCEGSILHDLMTCAHGSGEGIQLSCKVATYGFAVPARCAPECARMCAKLRIYKAPALRFGNLPASLLHRPAHAAHLPGIP